MPAGPWIPYVGMIQSLAGNDANNIDLDQGGTPRFRMTLHTSSYVPVRSTHATWADVSASEVSGTGYTANGKLLAVTLTRPGSPPQDDVVFDCDDQSWTSSTITAKYAIITQDADANGTIASTDRLIAYCNLETGGGSVSTTNGTFAITIHANGVFRFSSNFA